MLAIGIGNLVGSYQHMLHNNPFVFVRLAIGEPYDRI